MNIDNLTKKQREALEKDTIQNAVMLGEWKDVQAIPVEDLRKWTNDPDKLHGLIFKGYEMKWGKVNTNGELYDEGAFDKFIEEYFVGRDFNMPVTVEHSYDPAWVVGRVLYIERNTVGFYFVVYIPETCPNYAHVKWLAEEGLLQGLSKEGFYTNAEWEQDEQGEWYVHVHELMMSRVSLVCTPANGVKFEAMQETKNGVRFVKKEDKSAIDALIKHN